MDLEYRKPKGAKSYDVLMRHKNAPNGIIRVGVVKTKKLNQVLEDRAFRLRQKLDSAQKPYARYEDMSV